MTFMRSPKGETIFATRKRSLLQFHIRLFAKPFRHTSKYTELSLELPMEGNTEIQPLILQDEVEGLLQNFSTTSQKSALDKDELLARLRTTRSALKAVYEVEEGNSLCSVS